MHCKYRTLAGFRATNGAGAAIGAGVLKPYGIRMVRWSWNLAWFAPEPDSKVASQALAPCDRRGPGLLPDFPHASSGTSLRCLMRQ